VKPTVKNIFANCHNHNKLEMCEKNDFSTGAADNAMEDEK